MVPMGAGCGVKHGGYYQASWSYKERTLFRNEEDKLEQLERKTIPTSGEISLFIIAFL
jgi:hypothetical protein